MREGREIHFPSCLGLFSSSSLSISLSLAGRTPSLLPLFVERKTLSLVPSGHSLPLTFVCLPVAWQSVYPFITLPPGWGWDLNLRLRSFSSLPSLFLCDFASILPNTQGGRHGTETVRWGWRRGMGRERGGSSSLFWDKFSFISSLPCPSTSTELSEDASSFGKVDFRSSCRKFRKPSPPCTCMVCLQKRSERSTAQPYSASPSTPPMLPPTMNSNACRIACMVNHW
mmetsp:Transcript_53005/g.103685  ORF Transcript_53005/g.103685 Transcript_53005/m.103685 type:complete len:227 (-) Transcript_53005:43-723(-)